MRIIGGKLSGKVILPPDGYKARPTTDFAKEGLFNILDNEYDFTDLKILDLFGGTGAISLEFASRGVGEVTCIEMAQPHVNFIKSTIARFGMADVVKVLHYNVFDYLPVCGRKFDIVFADPPYAIEGLDTLPEKVFAADILFPGAYFILDHPGEYSFKENPYFLKERKYGNVHFSFFMKPESE